MTVTTWPVDGFASSLSGASAHTRAAYLHDVHEFVTWAERGGCPAPRAVDHRTLRRYLAYLDTRGFARTSIARKAAALRAYLRYLHRHGAIDTDPGRALRTPKGTARLPRVVRADEADALIEAAAAIARDDTDDRRGGRPASSTRSCCATWPCSRCSTARGCASPRRVV